MMITSTDIVVVGAPWRELTFVELQTDNGLRGQASPPASSKRSTTTASVSTINIGCTPSTK